MKGIIIAAGVGRRLKPLTDDKPKCMLEIRGEPILKKTVDSFRKIGVNDISIITGYKKEKINFSNVTYFENDDFLNNNILHSLMYARPKLEEAFSNNEEVIITYSDILYHQQVIAMLTKEKNDIAIVVDVDWDLIYDDRKEHPISEAEKIIMDAHQRIVEIGKDLTVNNIPKMNHGEFIGLWKFSSKGIEIFLKYFDKVNKSHNKTSPFQNAKEWQKAYITDMFQELIDNGEKISGCIIHGMWREFDTIEDFTKISIEHATFGE